MGASDPLRSALPPVSNLRWLLPVGSLVRARAWAGVALAAVMLVVLGGGPAAAAPLAGPAPVGMVGAPAPPVSTLDLQGCTGTARNPHYSNGARGIIFKMHPACRTTRTVDFLQGRLYKCPRVPTAAIPAGPARAV